MTTYEEKGKGREKRKGERRRRKRTKEKKEKEKEMEMEMEKEMEEEMIPAAVGRSEEGVNSPDDDEGIQHQREVIHS